MCRASPRGGGELAASGGETLTQEEASEATETAASASKKKAVMKNGVKRRRASRLTTTHAKLLSFGYSASSVAWNRFCSLWLLKCGYLPRQVGAMKSLSLLGKLIAQPLWAGTADAGNPPAVLALSLILSSATLEALRLGTRQDYADHEPFEAGHNWHIPGWWLWSWLGLSSSSKERSHHAAINEALPTHLYWRVAALRVARSASSAASPVADAMVLALARDGGEAWGRQRFWGSASWGLGSLAVGAIIDRLGLEIGLFGVSHLMSLCLLVFLLARVEPAWASPPHGEQRASVPTALPELLSTSTALAGSSQVNRRFLSTGGKPGEVDLDEESSDEKKQRKAWCSARSWCRTDHHRDSPEPQDVAEVAAAPAPAKRAKSKGPRSVLRAISRGTAAVRQSAPLRLVLVDAVAFGTAVVSVDSILYMQLEAELQVSRTLSGLATAASTAATFPIFWSSQDLVKRYGYWTVLCLAQCVLPLRLLLHATITKRNVGYALLPIQLLHGPMFAAWISAAVELVDRLAPPDLRCSVQSLLTMSYFTLGGCFGHLIWSTVFELYQGRTTYLLAAAASAASLFAFALAARPHLSAEARAKRANARSPAAPSMQPARAQLVV